MSFTSDTGSDAVDISDIEADFATGVGLDTCKHDDNNNDWEEDGDGVDVDDEKKTATSQATKNFK